MNGIRFIWINLIHFALKQAWASLFGFLLLVAMIVTAFIDVPFLFRYDVLFLWAVGIQVVLVVTKLETIKEAYMIFIFHLVATVMELYKTSSLIGSWQYPEPATIAFMGVPLFAGFMYSAVGSYIARSWKLMRFKFTNYPPVWQMSVLALGIYINFFTHHFVFDFRYVLVLATFVLLWKTSIYYTPKDTFKMPLALGFLLVSFFIWIAENVATFTNVWLYPSQEAAWSLVSPHKIVAWFLLMIISFVLVSLLYQKDLRN